MKDWKLIAQASGVPIPAADLDRTIAPLDNLEKVFRPLAQSLDWTVETSVIYTSSLEDNAE